MSEPAVHAAVGWPRRVPAGGGAAAAQLPVVGTAQAVRSSNADATKLEPGQSIAVVVARPSVRRRSCRGAAQTLQDDFAALPAGVHTASAQLKRNPLCATWRRRLTCYLSAAIPKLSGGAAVLKTPATVGAASSPHYLLFRGLTLQIFLIL